MVSVVIVEEEGKRKANPLYLWSVSWQEKAGATGWLQVTSVFTVQLQRLRGTVGRQEEGWWSPNTSS